MKFFPLGKGRRRVFHLSMGGDLRVCWSVCVWVCGKPCSKVEIIILLFQAVGERCKSTRYFLLVNREDLSQLGKCIFFGTEINVSRLLRHSHGRLERWDWIWRSLPWEIFGKGKTKFPFFCVVFFLRHTRIDFLFCSSLCEYTHKTGDLNENRAKIFLLFSSYFCEGQKYFSIFLSLSLFLHNPPPCFSDNFLWRIFRHIFLSSSLTFFLADETSVSSSTRSSHLSFLWCWILECCLFCLFHPKIYIDKEISPKVFNPKKLHPHLFADMCFVNFTN